MRVRCDNCGHETTDGKLKVRLADIPDLQQRLDVGGVVPAGECPQCGALTYIIDKPAGTNGWTVVGTYPGEDSFVDWVEAGSPEAAAKKAIRQRAG